MNRRPASLVAFWLCLCATAASLAASHRDWTVVPLGTIALAPGTQEVRLARPFDRHGLIEAPIVLVAFFDTARQQQTPIEVEFSNPRQTLPTWKITEPGQMYVIGLAAQMRAAGGGNAVLPLRIELRGAAGELALMASGAPDLALAGDDALGPLEQIAEQMPPGAEREYIRATLRSSGADLPGAQRELRRLAGTGDTRVARAARAALRRIEFARSEPAAALDAPTHLRLALYAQQCGLFRSARLHFEASLAADAAQPEAWLRLGEVMDRCGDPIDEVAGMFERAGYVGRAEPNSWNVVVVTVLDSPSVAAAESAPDPDAPAEPPRQSPDAAALDRVAREWSRFEKMIFGVSRGRLELNTRFVRIRDAETAGFQRISLSPADGRATSRPSELLAPPPDLVGPPGSTDWLVVFRSGGSGLAFDPLHGINAAAFNDLPADADWQHLLLAFARVISSTAGQAELHAELARLPDGLLYGHEPLASDAAAIRAALSYAVAPAAFAQLKLASSDTQSGFVRNWYVDEPRPGAAAASEHDRPLAELVAPARLDHSARFVAAARPALSLAELSGGQSLAPRSLIRATTYVLSPRRQTLRLWLGYDGRLAVWLNDELVLSGAAAMPLRPGGRPRENMLCRPVTLQRGWNRLDIALERPAAPAPGDFGLAVRLADLAERGNIGLRMIGPASDVPRFATRDPLRPEPGRWYSWRDVRDDWPASLPRLSEQSLRDYAQFPASFTIAADRAAAAPVIRLDRSADTTRTGARVRLDALLDWSREFLAVAEMTKNGRRRHLLLVRPDAIDAVLTCLKEADAARDLFAGRRVSDRLLGVVQIGSAAAPLRLIAVEALLPDVLPWDEEDLLSPG